MAYAGDLFDRNGPIQYAQAVSSVSDAMSKVVGSFVALGSKSTPVLAGIKQQLTDIINMSGQLNQNLGSAGAGASGSGSGWTPSRVANSGMTGGQQGNSTGVGGVGAGAGTTYRQQSGPMPQGTAAPGAQALGSMGMRAAESILPVAGQAASSYVQQNLAGFQQSVLLGGYYARQVPGGWTNANQKQFSRIPQGQYALSQQDYAQAGYAQTTLTGVPSRALPGMSSQTTQNVNTMNSAINAQMVTNPGISRTQSAQSISNLYTPQTMRGMMMMGLQPTMQGGVQQDPNKIFQQVLGSFVQNPDTLTPDQFRQLMSQNGNGSVVANQAFGGDPNLIQMFTEWGLAKTSAQQKNPGAASQNFLTPQALKAAGFTSNSTFADLSKTSAQARAQSQVASGTDQATKVFSEASKTFSDAVAKLLGGGNGAVGNVVGQGLGFLGKLGGPFGALAGIGNSLLGLGGGAKGFLGSLSSLAGGFSFNSSTFGSTPSALQSSGQPSGAGGFSYASGPKTATNIGYTFGGASGGTLFAGVSSIPRALLQGVNFSTSNPPTSGGNTPPPDPGTSPSTGTPVSPGATGVQAMVQALYNAGFRGSALQSMVAYGISESSGNSNVLNDNPSTGDYSVGWFQINYFGNLRSSRTAKYGDPASLRANPQAQANAAWDLSAHGTNFGPWVGDISNGHFKQNLPAAQAAVKAAGYARGSQQIDMTKLALLHKGERVVSAADNFSMGGRYARGQTQDQQSAMAIHFNRGSIVVQAVTSPTNQTDAYATGQSIGDGILAKLRGGSS